MANVREIKRKTTTITLSDGVERELKYTLNALAELEDIYGSVEAAFEKLEKQNSIKALRSVLYAGLMHTKEFKSELEVGDLLDIESMEALMQSVGEAFESDMPADNKTLLQVATDPNV